MDMNANQAISKQEFVTCQGGDTGIFEKVLHKRVDQGGVTMGEWRQFCHRMRAKKGDEFADKYGDQAVQQKLAQMS